MTVTHRPALIAKLLRSGCNFLVDCNTNNEQACSFHSRTLRLRTTVTPILSLTVFPHTGLLHLTLLSNLAYFASTLTTSNGTSYGVDNATSAKEKDNATSAKEKDSARFWRLIALRG